VDEVAAVDCVQQVSPQYFLATVKAGCCSMPVQIIGIDPKTDFTIQPWIDHSYGKELERGDVAVGCNITGQVGSKIMFYGRECTIVAKLDQTGTALDNAAFCNAETIRDLIDGSAEQGLAVLADQDPADIVSTIQVKVADDANVSDVVDNINLHVRNVRAVQSKAMTHDVAQSMAGVSQIIGALVVGIWLLAVAVLAVTFWVLGRTRTKEFGILRVLGATFRSIVRIVMCESLVTSACGAALGILIAGFATVGFSGAIEAALGLPFLLPDVTTFVLVALLTFVIALVVGMLASAVSVRRFAKIDEAHILRDE
jgi:putative ABC transport system permease protein